MAQDEIRVWSYEANFSNPRDVVRLLSGDTERSMGLLYDDELNWLLTQQANPYLCAAAACDLIGAKLAKRPDISIAGQSARLGERVQWYSARADSLRLEAGRHGGATAIGIGALLVLEDAGLQAATGVIPAFRRNQFGHPENRT
jgi:hypothetical protein